MQTVFRRAAYGTLAMSIGTLIVLAGEPRAQSSSPSAEQAAALPAMVRVVLAEALANEEEQNRRGWRRVRSPRVTFPLPVCLFEHGLCGSVNRDGSLAVAPQYDFVDTFQEGRALVRRGGLYGYVDERGNIAVAPKYSIAGRYRHGLAEVDIDGKSALIDTEGRQVLSPRFARAGAFSREVFWVNDGARNHRGGHPGSEEFPDVHNGHNCGGSAQIVRAGGRWGLIGVRGEWIRAPTFSQIDVFDGEDSDVMWAKADTGWGLIRSDGTWLAEPVYDHKGKLSDGLAAVWQGGKLGYIDRAGQLVIPLKFDTRVSFSEFAGGMPAPAKLGGREGLIDRSGNWVIEPAYDSISPRHGGERSGSDREFEGFVVQLGGKMGLLDRSGKELIAPQLEKKVQPPARNTGGGFVVAFSGYDFPMLCEDGRIIGLIGQKPHVFTADGTLLRLQEGELWKPNCDAPHVVKVGERFGYVDAALRPLIEAKFEAAGAFHHGYAAAMIAGKYGLIRQDGSWALEPEFDAAGVLTNELAVVKAGGRAALVTMSSARLVTPARFDDICPRGRGLLGVMVGGHMGVIDHAGAWRIAPRYKLFGWGLTAGYIPVQSDGRWGFLDAAGNLIETKFEDAKAFERGLAWVKSSGAWCAIDRRGDRVPRPCRQDDPYPPQRRSAIEPFCSIVQ